MFDPAFRPQTLTDFIGQERIKQDLSIAIAAARSRGDPVDHIMFIGPSGSGKVTLASIVANAMGGPLRHVRSADVPDSGQLAGVLTDLQRNNVLLIEEIDSLRPPVGDILHQAMTSFAFEITIGKGPSARTLNLKLPLFSVIGTTTRPSSTLRAWFPLVYVLAPYQSPDLALLMLREAFRLGIKLEYNAAMALASRAGNDPANALRLLRRARDYATTRANGVVTTAVAADTLAAWVGYERTTDAGPDQTPQGQSSRYIPESVRAEVWARDRGCCVDCGARTDLQFDHVIPWSKGGATNAANIELRCQTCNLRKSNRI